MQRCDAHASRKVGLEDAASDRALIRRPDVLGLVNPHFMGKTERVPALFVAITGTMQEGETSPALVMAVAF